VTPDAGADALSQPDSASCQGDATLCLSGTVAMASTITATPRHLFASLYRVVPSGQAMPLSSQAVAKDGTWAFGNLAAWTHYFVRITADFAVGDAQPATLLSVAGPLTVPSSGQPLAIQVKPVQLEVFESRVAGGSMQVQFASAHVFDPTSADEIQGGAQVSVDVGGASTPMPWGTDLAGNPAYFVQFSTPPAAQASYTISTSAPAFGSTPLTWTLSADAPTFDGAIASPAANATIALNQPLTVTWPAQPSADYEVVELFFKDPGGWTGKWQSPAPDAPDTTQETIPASAIASAGQYLLNVVFAKGSCPVTSDGCVYAASIAAAQLTAQ
jgi:hypothetical protein